MKKKNNNDADTEQTAVNYNPPPGIKSVPYDYTPANSGVTAAKVKEGELPKGLNLNPSTGAITGTPEEPREPTKLTFGLVVAGEEVDATTEFTVYEPMKVERFEDDESAGEVEAKEELTLVNTKRNKFVPSGGSGKYEYAISGDNVVTPEGELQINEPGKVTLTVIDAESGQQDVINLLVSSQGSICGFAVESDAAAANEGVPCVDVITDCETPVTIAFNALTLLRGIEAGEMAYREPLRFTDMEGADISNNNKYFAGFRSTAANGFAVAENALDGYPFLIEFAVHASVIAATTVIAVGFAHKFTDGAKTLLGLDYAAGIAGATPAARKVGIYKDGVLVVGSDFAVLEGQQVGLAVYGDSVILYIDGLVKYTVTGSTFACAGTDIVIFSSAANVVVGGQAANLVFSIATTGTAAEIGTIDPQSGLYTPAEHNIGLVVIKGTNLTNALAVYEAKVRVIKPAVKASFEKAMVEGVPIDMWVCGPTRYDELPLRLDRDGRPDRNQVEDPRHLGTLAGSGRIETTPTRNEFRNDRGATSTSLTFDKVVISGAYLNVRDFATVKRLIPYKKELNSNGVRTLRQYSTGCQHKMRILMVWATPDCGDVTVYDAIEIFNGLSYTPFTLEVGQTVQSQIALTIEGFPNQESALFDYNQYNQHFIRIGS